MERLRGRYGDVGLEQAEVVVALGGDGLMLQTLRDAMEKHIPVFGMNCGSVGFLMNDYADDGLFERLAAAKPTRIAPLAMHVRDTDGGEHDALALNEVSLFRITYQAMNNPGAAKQAFESALQRNPADEDARRGLLQVEAQSTMRQ